MTPPTRPEPPTYYRDDELRVEPELIRINARRQVCSNCGDELFPGEWRSIEGRCAICIDQGALLKHWGAAIAVIVVGILVIAIVGWLTLPAPRGALESSSGPGRGDAATRAPLGAPAVPAGSPAAAGVSPGSGVTSVAVIAPPLEVIRGTATHYCLPGQRGTAFCTRGYGPEDLVAAIDTDLGFEKGDVVLVRSLAGDGEVIVRIVDVCGCPGERLIDLTSGAFRRLAPLGLGVIPVTVELAGARTTLPPTETAP